MSLESGMPLPKKAETQPKEIKITSPDEYLSILGNYQTEEGLKEDRSKQSQIHAHEISEKIAGQRLDKRFKSYAAEGLLEEEVGYFSRDEEIHGENASKLADAWLECIENGYMPIVVPVSDENDKYIGNKVFRVKMDTYKEKTAVRTAIDLEWREEESHSWFYEEQEKEKEFQLKVRNGEMVYLGEIDFDKYVSLKKTGGFRNVDTEDIWVFDEDKNVNRDVMRYYAYLPPKK